VRGMMRGAANGLVIEATLAAVVYLLVEAIKFLW
jgi:hypothetical protein